MSVAQINAIDSLVERLNELEGIEFAKDAWVNKAPEVYGVVTLNGDNQQLWADGHLIDTIWGVTVAAYVDDDDDTWPDKVQAKLEELEDQDLFDLVHRVNREFDYETGKVRWEWTVMLYGPLVRG